MATITPVLPHGIHVGQRVAFKTHELLWRTVGQGQIVAFSDREIVVDGQVTLAIYRGDLTVRFALLDQDDAAVTGPCRLQVNSLVDEDANYTVENNGLTVSSVLSGKNVRVKLSRGERDNRTECQVVRPLDLTVYAVPISV